MSQAAFFLLQQYYSLFKDIKRALPSVQLYMYMSYVHILSYVSVSRTLSARQKLINRGTEEDYLLTLLSATWVMGHLSLAVAFTITSTSVWVSPNSGLLSFQ